MREVCTMLSIITFLYPQQMWTDSEQFDSEPSDSEDSDQGEHQGEERDNSEQEENEGRKVIMRKSWNLMRAVNLNLST